MLYLQLFYKSSSREETKTKISFSPFVYTAHFRAGCAISITVRTAFSCSTLILYPEEGHMHTLTSILQEDVYQLQ